MRVRRNLVRMPSQARFRALVKSKGVPAAEEAALRAEERAGILPWQATPEGLVAEDYVHLLLEGERSFKGILGGAAFYDPVGDEAVLVTPEGKEVLVEAGPLHLASRLSGFLASCLDHVVTAYGDDAGAAYIVEGHGL